MSLCSDVSRLVKSIGKGIDVKVSPILCAKVLVLVSMQSIGIVIGNTFLQVSLTSLINGPLPNDISTGFAEVQEWEL